MSSHWSPFDWMDRHPLLSGLLWPLLLTGILALYYSLPSWV